MTTAQEIRNLIEHTTTGTHRRRVPEEVKQQVRRYSEHRRAQGATWQAVAKFADHLSLERQVRQFVFRFDRRVNEYGLLRALLNRVARSEPYPYARLTAETIG